ncbi:MAG: hypothetical protein Q8Q14_11815 [Gemmatimonadales bacterium]|nr:hypothetical protein [Gemmatimonadales bacterium]
MNWFNSVDATYRADLRQLNETNFARFDAKLGERLAELDAKWGGRWTELHAKLEQRVFQLDAKIAALGDTLRKELAQSLGQLKSDLLTWMFGFWASVVVALVLLAFRR